MQSLYQSVLINMAICCRSGVSASQIRVRQRLSLDFLKPAITDNLCRKGTWNRTKQLHNNNVFKHILYKNYLKPGWWPTVPCPGERRMTQNPTSDVRLYVRTGRKELLKDEQAAFISSDVFVISLSRSLFILSLQFTKPFIFASLRHELTDDECGSIKGWQPIRRLRYSTVYKVKGVDLQQNQADVQTVDIIKHLVLFLFFLVFPLFFISYFLHAYCVGQDKLMIV